MDATFWNDRFNSENYIYGQEPNAFLKEVRSHIPRGKVLCIAEGEGRNAAHLAGHGYEVTAVDQSDVGLAKARRLAGSRGLKVHTVVSGLEDYRIAPGAWSGIVSIFAHVPPVLRRQVHTQAVQGLRPGGVFILEAYTPAQLAFGTGGPKALELLMRLEDLRSELAGLEFLIAREVERDVREGQGHTGRGAVVQVVARRPGTPIFNQ